mmetsp:Transcript_16139/g.27726  ORF Transcript_16139/g.27726 Transcript_16139/m.27726 type:complete len:206 (+) Transcript_16139:540-1157(+)
MISAEPAKLSMASSRHRSVWTSRSLVGSSSSSRLPGCCNTLARCRRLRSPPERTPVFLLWSLPPKLNQLAYCRELTFLPPKSISSRPPEISWITVLLSSRDSRLCSTYMGTTVSPITSWPESGFSMPIIILKSVDLPAPFPPTMPTTAPGGIERLRFSINKRSPKDLVTPTSSRTLSPRRGPTGMVMASIWVFFTCAVALSTSSS